MFLVGLVAWASLGLDQAQVFDQVRAWQSSLAMRPWITGPGLVALFALAMGLGLPGGSVFVLAAGYLFGVGIGLGIGLLGGLGGALLTLGMVRMSGWRFKDHHLPDTWLNRRPFILLVGLRSVPVFPFTLVSVVGGMMRLSTFDYAMATMLGSIPPMSLLVIIGYRFSQHLAQPGMPDPWQVVRDPGLWVPGMALGLLVLAAWWFRRRLDSRA